MKIQRFKQFINENDEYLDEPEDSAFYELLSELAGRIDGTSGWSARADKKSNSLYIDQDWMIDELDYNNEEPRVYATYAVVFKLSFQDDSSQLSPELVRLYKLGLAPVNELIKGFDHDWSFNVDSKDVPELEIYDGSSEFEFISLEDLTGNSSVDLTDLDSFAEDLIETLNGWVDEQTYMLNQRIQEELDEIGGRYDSDDEEEDEDEDDSDEDDSDDV